MRGDGIRDTSVTGVQTCALPILPVFLAGRNPHYIPGMDRLHGIAPSLYPAHARGDDERLAKRVGVPRRTRTRLERHIGGGHVEGSLRDRKSVVEGQE